MNGGSPHIQLADIAASQLDLDRTLNCGQVFHWERAGPGFAGVIGGVPLYLEQRGDRLIVPAGSEVLVSHYLALDHPLPDIYATFPGDASMRAALEFCRGLRIIRQPLWECVATFITSSMKQVAHIRQMSLAIRRHFGRRLNLGGVELFDYPSPDTLAQVPLADLLECRLGYRAKNLLGAARMIASGEVTLESLRECDTETARVELCRLPGVGEKVANCALLFAYERLDVVPIDVWIGRVLREIYFAGKRKVTPRRIKLFSKTHFGPFAGYAQQYLFHHARKTYRATARAKHESRRRTQPRRNRSAPRS